MELTSKSAELSDFSALEALAAGDSGKLMQLGILKEVLVRRARGDHRIGGYPDSIVIAVENGEIVGYRHWYTDCWENYELVEVGTSIKASLPKHAQQLVRAFLDYHYEEERLDGI